MPKTKKKSGTKAAKPEVDETEEDDLEELEDDEASDTPAKKGSDEVVFGVSDIAKIVSKGREKPISARDLRTLLRKMARDGRLDREIKAGNRQRWSWAGPDDPEVKAIVAAVKSGELEAGKQEALAKLKAQKAAKQAEKEKAAKKAGKTKPAPVEDDDEDDDEE